MSGPYPSINDFTGWLSMIEADDPRCEIVAVMSRPWWREAMR
jgi:hypothetical protein